MSDIFDHMNDAFDRHEADQGDEDGCLDPVELMRSPARRLAEAAIAHGMTSRPNHSIRSGQPRGRPTRKRPASPEGDGPCPKCGQPTRLVTKGAFGPFHGCTKFPACKGTRRATAEEIAAADDDEAFWAERGIDTSEPDRERPQEGPRTQPAYGKYPYGIKHHSDSLKGTR
jgi:hypothetical protein